MRNLMILILLGLATSCASLDYTYGGKHAPTLEREVLGDVEPQRELVTLALDDAIKARLDERIDADWRQKRKLRELRQYLFSEDELGITYDAAASRTAVDTFNERSGNCLAMTNLFVAAARYVGLDANYQTVMVKPTWDHEGETMIRYEHIVAVGNVGPETYTVDFLPEFLIGDRPTEDISDQQALALFYNNLGAEAVVDNEPDQAITFLRQALALNPDHSDTWNNMGAAMRRAGRDAEAEYSYVRSLNLDPYNYSALSNLSQFYESTGRVEDAEDISARVERYRRRNPYFHYFVAQVFAEEGKLDESIVFLKQAIRLKKDEPQFYEALARVYQRQGAKSESERQLAMATRYREAVSVTPPERTMNHRIWVKKNM